MKAAGVIKPTVAIILLATGGVLAARYFGGGDGPSTTHGYYWDESAARLYTAPVASLTPHAGVDGGTPDGWRAVVFTCSDCSQANRQIGYIERMTEELAALHRSSDETAEAGGPIPEQLRDRAWVARNTLVRDPESAEWVPLDSESGLRVTQVMSNPCPNGSYPRLCVPGE